MKSLEWQAWLLSQQREHGKSLYTVTELANAAGTSGHAMNVEASRLCVRGILCRYAHGIYGIPDAVSPEMLIAELDSCSYLTGMMALVRHGMVTQLPTTFDCFTSRRPRRTRILTRLGTCLIHSVKPPIYCMPPQAVLVPPEQALCDLVYLARRQSVTPEATITFRNLHKLRPGVLKSVLRRYPEAVREHVQNRLLLNFKPAE